MPARSAIRSPRRQSYGGETEIRRVESRFAELRSFFRRNQDRQPRAATIRSERERALPRRASAWWPLDTQACSGPPSPPRRERKQSKDFPMRELAEGDAPRFGRSKCAKAERSFFPGRSLTHVVLRTKVAMAYRAVGETKSGAENAAPG